MVRKLELYSATHESVTVLVAKYNENPDRTKNQLDCRIPYRAFWEKIKYKICKYIW